MGSRAQYLTVSELYHAYQTGGLTYEGDIDPRIDRCYSLIRQVGGKLQSVKDLSRNVETSREGQYTWGRLCDIVDSMKAPVTGPDVYNAYAMVCRKYNVRGVLLPVWERLVDFEKHKWSECAAYCNKTKVLHKESTQHTPVSSLTPAQKKNAKRSRRRQLMRENKSHKDQRIAHAYAHCLVLLTIRCDGRKEERLFAHKGMMEHNVLGEVADSITTISPAVDVTLLSADELLKVDPKSVVPHVIINVDARLMHVVSLFGQSLRQTGYFPKSYELQPDEIDVVTHNKWLLKLHDVAE